MLSFHFLFTRKPTPACPLLASEWYSRWPLWRVVKLSSCLRTFPSPTTSHFMTVLLLFLARVHLLVMFLLCCNLQSLSPCVVVLLDPEILSTTLYVVSVDPNHLLGHMRPCCWGLGALAYLYFACWFSCGLEGGTDIGVPSLGIIVFQH